MPTLIQKGNTLPVCKSSSFILSLSHDLVDNDIDEFANTLLLIFEKKIVVCSDCDICNLYGLHEFGV